MLFFEQTMTSVRNKCPGIADDNAQPIEKIRIGTVGFVLMRAVFQSRGITAVTIAVAHAAIRKIARANFFTDTCLIWGITHNFYIPATGMMTKLSWL